ncbi:MAG: hypothetical protein GKR87_04775 [Kiritimatiellae bacterium]|nr:hypothetical protein [Kiritimatiellia bacterium]
MIGGVLFAIFFYGVGVGHHHWPPFSLLKNVQDFLSGRSDRSYDNGVREELLRVAFTDKLIPDEQINKPITSLDGIYEINASLMLNLENFSNAYSSLELLDASQLVLDKGNTKVFKVDYKLADTGYKAYAYFTEKVPMAKKAALIIPGSGLNQSSSIYRNEPTNYHFGIHEALGDAYDIYVLIKPNEDCSAFHNGRKKLNKNFVINWLLDYGASYSAHYIVSSLAITKHMQNKYDHVVVARLSRGGSATLLNALQSQPDAAIIASGFSMLNEKN